MKPQINVITLAVADLDRAVRFYRDGLGLQSEGIIATEFERDERSGAGNCNPLRRPGARAVVGRASGTAGLAAVRPG